MKRNLISWSMSRALKLLLIFSFLLAGQVALAHAASAATLGSDDFNRANGSLGTGWAAISGGAMSISSQQVIGKANTNTGEIRTAESYPSDQFSQIQVTSKALTGGQWIAAAVRMQSSGQNAYAGLYYWNFGSPELMLFKRSGGSWSQLGGVYNSGALAAGTQLQLTAVGSTISLLQNGVQRLSVTDTSFTGGAPGIMAFGNSTADNWSGGSATAASFTVGGTVSGLSGTVVLQDNGGDDLSVTANGSFTFATPLAGGAAYNVTVKTNPSGQTCTVTGGSGAIGSANVTNVAVSCATTTATTYSVGGTVSGLSGTVVLQDNGGDDLSVTANGSFTFATKLASGAAYSVTVAASPTGQTCTVTSGSGTIASADVTSVAVSCATSGSGSGTSASDDFNRANGGLGASWTAISDGAMSISSQQVIGTAGATTGAARTAETYPSDQFSQIQVTSTALTGGQWIAAAVRMQSSGQNAYAGLYYWNFGSPELMLFERSGGGWTQLGGVYNSGALTAGTQLKLVAAGSTISFLQNGVQRLSVNDTSLTGGAPGIMAYGNSTADNWSGGSGTGGTTTTYSVGGTVSGLSGTVVLQDNGGDDLSVTANGPFTFATKVASGSPYSVTVKTSPSGQTCTVTSGSGTVGSADITNVAVSCTTAGTTFSVGGTVSGLSGTVVLQDNGGDDLSVTANGSFTFATKLASGAAYSVTVATNPSGQTCTVTSGSGTIGSANVTNVAVSCAASTGGTASDDFNRSDGGLGASWTAISDGAMSISGQQVIGTAGATTGATRTAETYTSDQFSQIQVTSTALTGGQWIAAAVRMQNGGQNAYAGLYYWNFGSPELMLFERSGGSWTQLGGVYNSGVLTAGTLLRITVTGSTVSFLQNGVQRLSVNDTSLTGGAPGIMAYGNSTADNWSGGNGSGGSITTYSVGGTVSGLAGTLVLQDNGTDDLSISANGPFTFATKVPSGAGYLVTVESAPASQNCTITNGSGTIGSANVTNVTISCANVTSTPGADDFNRADGSVGSSWTATSDGAMSISNQMVIGTAGQSTGEIRTAETYSSDQYSQIEVTSTQLTGTQWIGAAARMQNSGQSGYVGIYTWNSGSPQLQLYVRNAGSWSQLGSYNSGALAAGTQLRLVAVGNTIALLQNGVQRIAVSDSTFNGGAPGIMANGAATGDNWAGQNTGFQVSPGGTSNGVKSYNVISANNGYGPQTIRVLAPTSPAAGVAHNFLVVLPVETGLGNTFGDGLGTLQSLNAQNQYNVTIIEPTFGIDSWYANNPNDPRLQYETFMTQELVPWIKQNLATTGSEQMWLIGFSKSGIGGQDLILKHPDLFTLAASWDFPADMATYDGLGSNPAANYGTDANYQANYRLTQAFVDARKAPFVASNRIWIGGYSLYQGDMTDYNNLLNTEGILHSTETPTSASHRWDSGWMPLAMAALYQDSTSLH
jgi:putative esterase